MVAMGKTVAAVRPEIMKYWTGNGNDPRELSSGSQKFIRFICPGCCVLKEVRASVISRLGVTSCKPCANKKSSNSHIRLHALKESLISYPDYLKDWDYASNLTDPSMVPSGHDKRVFWKCSKCQTKWRATVYSRIKQKTGCPKCSLSKRGNSWRRNAAIKNPITSHQLYDEWDYELNDKAPSEYSATSNFKVHWICLTCKLKFKQTVSGRAKGTGCPKCNMVKGQIKRCNGFAVRNPLASNAKLCEEWDYELNKTDPTKLSRGSGEKVWWRCRHCGNKWKAIIHNRTKGRGCPRCRQSHGEKSIEELLLKQRLRKDRDFFTQKRFPGMVNKTSLRLDFYIPCCNTAVEYQGEGHYFPIRWGGISEEQAKENLKSVRRRDQIKRRYCKKHGIRLIEIRYDEDIEAKLRKELADCIPSLRKGTRSSTATAKRPSTKSKRKKSTSC